VIQLGENGFLSRLEFRSLSLTVLVNSARCAPWFVPVYRRGDQADATELLKIHSASPGRRPVQDPVHSLHPKRTRASNRRAEKEFSSVKRGLRLLIDDQIRR
jgi:hypothetical protein